MDIKDSIVYALGKTSKAQGEKDYLGLLSALLAKKDAHKFTDDFWFPQDKRLPAAADLRVTTCVPYPRVLDQREEGTCVGHALSAAYQCVQRREGIPFDKAVQPSPDFIYSNARSQMSARARQKVGATFEASIADLLQGAVPHGEYQRSGRAQRSPNRIKHASRLGRSLYNIKRCLGEGFPVVLGFQTTDAQQAWQDSDARMRRTGHVLPARQPHEPFTGAHAVALVGYSDALRCFFARNSWGPHWGIAGHFYVPYEFVLDKDSCRDMFFISATATE